MDRWTLTDVRAVLQGKLIITVVAPLGQPKARVLRLPSGLSAALTLAALAASIAGTLAFLLLHKDRADAEARRLATIDPLTSAYNRTTFHEIAERELSRARRQGQPLSIVMFDIDHFRAINEKHGHRLGDEVLRKFADLVRTALRKEDMLVRFGGEEFLVMLPDVPGPGAQDRGPVQQEGLFVKPICFRGYRPVQRVADGGTRLGLRVPAPSCTAV